MLLAVRGASIAVWESGAWRPEAWPAPLWFMVGALLLLLALLGLRRGRPRPLEVRPPQLLITQGEVFPDAMPETPHRRRAADPSKAAAGTLSMTVSNLSRYPVQLLEVALRQDSRGAPRVAEVETVVPAMGSVDVTGRVPLALRGDGWLDVYCYAAAPRHKLYRHRAELVWEPWAARFKVAPMEQSASPARRLASDDRQARFVDEAAPEATAVPASAIGVEPSGVPGTDTMPLRSPAPSPSRLPSPSTVPPPPPSPPSSVPPAPTVVAAVADAGGEAPQQLAAGPDRWDRLDRRTRRSRVATIVPRPVRDPTSSDPRIAPGAGEGPRRGAARPAEAPTPPVAALAKDEAPPAAGRAASDLAAAAGPVPAAAAVAMEEPVAGAAARSLSLGALWDRLPRSAPRGRSLDGAAPAVVPAEAGEPNVAADDSNQQDEPRPGRGERPRLEFPDDF